MLYLSDYSWSLFTAELRSMDLRRVSGNLFTSILCSDDKCVSICHHVWCEWAEIRPAAASDLQQELTHVLRTTSTDATEIHVSLHSCFTDRVLSCHQPTSWSTRPSSACVTWPPHRSQGPTTSPPPGPRGPAPAVKSDKPAAPTQDCVTQLHQWLLLISWNRRATEKRELRSCRDEQQVWSRAQRSGRIFAALFGSQPTQEVSVVDWQVTNIWHKGCFGMRGLTWHIRPKTGEITFKSSLQTHFLSLAFSPG